MPKQPALVSLRDAMKEKLTRSKWFWTKMEAVVPWARQLVPIAPHHPWVGPKGDRPLMLVDLTLRLAGIELGGDLISDESMILNVRHLLERHGLTHGFFADRKGHPPDKCITLRSGAPMGATILDAPSSTWNNAGPRDFEMSDVLKMSYAKNGNA